MLSPYSTVVEKLHRDVNKERVTMLKVERAGDVLVDAVSPTLRLFTLKYSINIHFFYIIQTAGKSGSVHFAILQRPRPLDLCGYAGRWSRARLFDQFGWLKWWVCIGTATSLARYVNGGIWQTEYSPTQHYRQQWRHSSHWTKINSFIEKSR